MAIKLIGELRRGLIINQGPGCILEFRSNKGAPISVINSGLESWQEVTPKKTGRDPNIITSARLAEILKTKWKEIFDTDQEIFINYFRVPPVSDDKKAPNSTDSPREMGFNVIPTFRFPNYLYCKNCKDLKDNRVDRWDQDENDASLYCPKCSNDVEKEYVIAHRFVIACENGHISDFPWKEWLSHFGGNSDCDHSRLSIQGDSPSMGSGGQSIYCHDCGTSASLKNAFDNSVFKEMNFKCPSDTPWHGPNEKDKNRCNLYPRTVLKNSSSQYFPVTESIIDIPPWTNDSLEKWNLEFENVFGLPEERQKEHLENHFVVNLSNLYQEDKLVDLIKEFEEYSQYRKNNDLDPLTEEYLVLNRQEDPSDEEEFSAYLNNRQSNFKATKMEDPERYKEHIDKIVQISRLREVNVLLAFKRLNQPFSNTESGKGRFSLLSKNALGWFPAQEVFGEGIFFSLKEEKINAWEEDPILRKDAKLLNDIWQEKSKELRRINNKDDSRDAFPIITPRFLLLHTLSHALINQLALDSGYNVASLKERIYSSNFNSPQPMAGILIYTSANDAEGTLGSLSEKASTSTFEHILEGAIENQRICSNDPICIDGISSLSESYNPSACHSCLVLPETSCIFFNRFLDRRILAGNQFSEKISATDIKSFFDF